jgi:hypothetical protein
VGKVTFFVQGNILKVHVFISRHRQRGKLVFGSIYSPISNKIEELEQATYILAFFDPLPPTLKGSVIHAHSIYAQTKIYPQ